MSFAVSALCTRSILFFFQAEDGIRDLVRSRGLGDVYKRQGGANGTTGLLAQGNGVVQDMRIQPAVMIELDTWHSGAFDVPANTNTNGNHIALDLSLIHI